MRATEISHNLAKRATDKCTLACVGVDSLCRFSIAMGELALSRCLRLLARPETAAFLLGVDSIGLVPCASAIIETSGAGAACGSRELQASSAGKAGLVVAGKPAKVMACKCKTNGRACRRNWCFPA